MEQVGPRSVPLVSVSFLLWMLPLTDSQAPSRAPPPPAARLSVYPPSHTFIRGQQIRLNCTPPEGQGPAGFVYYKKNANGGWIEQSTLKGRTVRVSTMHLEPKETFVCSYWKVGQAGIRAQSEQSNQVEFSVLEPPATLLLEPQRPAYIQGERLTLHCLAPDGLEVTRYTFYKVQGDQSSEMLRGQQAGPHAQFHAEDQTAGEYSCDYQTMRSGRETRSQQSNLVSIAVISRPPPPYFSITPKHNVYKMEESINLNCSVPPGCPVSKILFFKDGRQVQQLTPSAALGTSFTYTLRLLPQDGGTYSCRYQFQEATRDVSSLDSSSISFQVLGPLHPPNFIVSPKRDAYRPGESIRLKCKIPPQQYHDLKVLFLKDEQQLHLTSSPSSKDTFTHSLRLSPPDSGRYSCWYQFVVSERQIQSDRSSFFQVSVMEPEFSTTVQAVQGNQTATELEDPTGTPMASALPSTSSHVGAGVGTPTCTQVPQVTSPSTDSQSSPSQDPVDLTTRPAEPPEATDSALTSSQPMRHASTPTSASSQGTSRPPVRNSSNPRGTTQSPEHLEGRPLGLLLAIGCGSGGAFVLLVLLVCLYWRKQKGSSRISSRAYWKSMKLQRSMRMRCDKDPVGIAITLQERDVREQIWPGSQDWGLLPKSKTPASNLGDPLKVKKRDEDADSGAELEFPEIDPTYMLLGFSCSTFRQEGNGPLKEEPRVFEERPL